MKWIDDVGIFCPCLETDDSFEADGNIIPNTLWNKLAVHPIEYLYFCDYCRAIRCPLCVEEEVVTRFCPSCLYEVSTNTARADGNRCLRNCFTCPRCDKDVTLTVEASGQDERREYNLKCPQCHYTTKDQGIHLNKKRSLASQIYEMAYLEKEKRFETLRQYFIETSLPSSIKSKHKKNVPNVIALEENPRSILYPELRKLRGKRAKRCMGCRHLLIKPESKPTSTQYRIKLMALNILPSIRVHGNEDVLKVETLHQYNMIVTNPQNTTMTINVSVVPPSNDYPHKVTLISSPTVTLGPCPELWDEESLLKGSSPLEIVRESKTAQRLKMEGGLNDLKKAGSLDVADIGVNWVSLEFEVVPGKADNCRVPFFMSLSFMEDHSKEATKIGLWVMVNLGEIKN